MCRKESYGSISRRLLISAIYGTSNAQTRKTPIADNRIAFLETFLESHWGIAMGCKNTIRGLIHSEADFDLTNSFFLRGNLIAI